MIRRLRFLLEAGLFGAILVVSRMVPRRALLAAGSALGFLGYHLNRRHRRIAEENVAAAYGDELSAAERRRLVRACWRHYGRTVLDAFAFPRFSAASVGTTIHYEGLERLREAYDEGKGVLVFSGHYGNWELVALMQAHMGMPMHMIARPLDNPMLEKMLARYRGLSGNVVVHKRSAVREMIRVLRDGGGIAFVIDQDARDSGVFVPFFGRLASTTPTLALVALRTGARVVPVFSVPGDDDSYRIVYGPPVEVRDTGDRDADVLRLTAECTAVLEGWVRKHPELWLWMHRRWKTPPPAEPVV